jgi:hypothetical protein
VNLSAYGEDFKPISMALYNQNKLIAKTIINFDAKKKKINFTIPKEAFHGYVTIEDNGLTYDNKLYFSISKAKKQMLSASENLKKVISYREFILHLNSIITIIPSAV